jgi:hypothetical protein
MCGAIRDVRNGPEADIRTKHCTKQKDRLAAAFPKIQPGVVSRSARTLRQASASPKGKVGFIAHFAGGDLQGFIRNVESKYFFVSLYYFQHGTDPFWFSSISSILLVDLLRATKLLILLFLGRTLEFS